MSIVCTTDARLRCGRLCRQFHRASLTTAFLLILLLASACARGNVNDPTPTSVVEVTATALSPTPTFASLITPTPTLSPSMEGLLDPGPAAQPSERIIFRNAGSLWAIAVDGTARRLTEGVRLGPWAQTVNGALAAFVVIRSEGDSVTEEIRFVTAEGQATAPIYGPVPVTGANAQPSILAVAWSWDASSLAVLRDDGSLGALLGLNDPFSDSSQLRMFDTPEGAMPDGGLTWAPTGSGIAYQAFVDAGYHSLFVSTLDEPPFPLLVSTGGTPRPISTFAWLPGRGRIAFVEDSGPTGSRTPSSIFTIAPDGSGRELLISASRFAPAATIGRLIASPDGRQLAFTVFVPNAQGQPTFESLWILNIDTDALREVPIQPGYRVTDTWFVSDGVIWRGVDVGARVTGDGHTYTGIEPFVLGLFQESEDAASSIIFQSTIPPS